MALKALCSHLFSLNAVPYGCLTKVFIDTKTPGRFYGVVKSWRQFQVIQFEAEGNRRSELVSLTPANWKNQKEKPIATADILEGYGSSPDSIHVSPEQKSIEISSGMFGLKQFFL